MSSQAERWVALRSSEEEIVRRRRMAELFDQAPMDRATLLYSQLTLFQSRQDLARVLLMADLYREHVVPVPGVVMEFGTFFGRNAALFSNLRAIFEPYNFTRKVVVFDTFQGLAGVTESDGAAAIATDGTYNASAASPTPHHEYLEQILQLHEAGAPVDHLVKHDLVVGDVRESTARYLADNPHTVVACAYLDLDLYEPTVAALRAITPHLTRSSLLVFDELNCKEFPGETAAMRECFGAAPALQRSPLHPWISWTDCAFL